MDNKKIINHIAADLSIRPAQISTVLDLFAQANTIPFIARYRKEATGELDEVQLRSIKERFEYEQALAQRKETVEQSITEQGKWTNELATRLEKARVLQDVEDLYLPYRPKKRTKASMARDAGLEPLADWLTAQKNDGLSPETAANSYINDAVPTTEEALQGAAYIIAERCSEDAPFRHYLRNRLWKQAKLECTLLVEDAAAKAMLTYKDFKESIRHIPSHRILALNRGEAQKLVKITLAANHDEYISQLANQLITKDSPCKPILEAAAADSYKRLIFPQMEREIRNELTAQAEKQAIAVFAENLRHLLLQPPLPGHTILGLDPGFRTGCKSAVIDTTGDVLDYHVFYLTGSEAQQQESATAMAEIIKKYDVTLISIGNGTASYETEQFVAKLIKEQQLKCSYLITNESGASVYSASELAREEMPDLDVSIRGAVSIARRVQDPLAELVKIDAESIGVGQYQHDVNQKQLTSTLDDVVDSVVNYVGVDLNTASPALLRHISGITSAIAANIVAYRNQNGPFHSRDELSNVYRLGPAAFTQCAGFLRIKNGRMPLDNTSVHPESYPLAEKIIQSYGFTLADMKNEKQLQLLQSKLQMNAAPKLSQELKAGLPTVRDILEELRKPGRDVRDELPKPLTRKNIMSLDELQVGTIVRGTVNNVVDFGAFVDFGLKTPGLIHRSELSTHPFKHPMDVIHVGDIIDAVIISVDAARGRIGLSIKQMKKQ